MFVVSLSVSNDKDHAVAMVGVLLEVSELRGTVPQQQERDSRPLGFLCAGAGNREPSPREQVRNVAKACRFVAVLNTTNALDQHAAAGNVDFRKRMTGGYVASNCSTA